MTIPWSGLRPRTPRSATPRGIGANIWDRSWILDDSMMLRLVLEEPAERSFGQGLCFWTFLKRPRPHWSTSSTTHGHSGQVPQWTLCAPGPGAGDGGDGFSRGSVADDSPGEAATQVGMKLP